MISFSTDIGAIRKFGLIVFVFFGVLCALMLWRHKIIAFYFFGLLTMLGIGFMVIPNILKPVYDFWNKLAHFVGSVITILILTVTYYLVITPSAMVKMLFGGRPLPLKPDKTVSSYWVKRSEPGQPRGRFLKRY